MKLIQFALMLSMAFSCVVKFSNEDTPGVSSFEKMPLPKNYQLILIDEVDNLKHPTKWKVEADFIYMLSQNSLFIYQVNGEFLFEVQELGCIIKDFAVGGGSLFLLCEDKGIVKKYSNKSFDFIEEISLDFNPVALEATDSVLFFYQTPNTLNSDPELNYELLISDYQGSILSRFYEYEDSPTQSFDFSVGVSSPFFKFGESISFSRFLNERIEYFALNGDFTKSEILDWSGYSGAHNEVTSREIIEPNNELVYFPVFYGYNDEIRLISFVQDLKLKLRVIEDGKKGDLNFEYFMDDQTGAIFVPYVYLNKDYLYLLIPDEAFIEYNSELNFEDTNWEIPANQLLNYERFQILIRFTLADLIIDY
jgi:hypothetical protein